MEAADGTHVYAGVGENEGGEWKMREGRGR